MAGASFPSSKTIAEFRSIYTIFKFKKTEKDSTEDRIFVKVKKITDEKFEKCEFNRSCLNNIKFPNTCLSDEQKVRFCLKNPHFRPKINIKTNSVFFKTILPSEKKWVEVNSFERCGGITKMVPLSDGSLAILSGSILVNVLSPRSDIQKTLNSPNFHEIVDCVELGSGLLALRSLKGSLELWDLKKLKYIKEIKLKDEKIQHIYPFSKDLIIFSSSEGLIVFDVFKNRRIQTIPLRGVLNRISDARFSILTKNKLYFYSLDDKSEKFERINSYDLNIKENQQISNYSFLSNGNILLILVENKKIKNFAFPKDFDYTVDESTKYLVKIFNPDKKTYVELKGEDFKFDSEFIEVDVNIDGKLKKYLATYLDNYSGEIVLWSPETGKNFKTIDMHSGKISKLKKLSDGAFVSGSWDKTAKIFASEIKKDRKNYHTVEALSNVGDIQELFDGSLAIRAHGQIKIIYPKMDVEDEIKKGGNDIDKLKKRLFEHPHDFKVYDCLAFESRFQWLETYNLYLMGIQEAMRVGDKYRARRFYEKALLTIFILYPDDKKEEKKINKEFKRVHQIYLNYLSDHNRKEKLKVYRKLLRRFPKEGFLEEYKKLMGKNYKKRLIIGDGNFSFTEDLIYQHVDTHPLLASSITATELTDYYLGHEDIKDRVKRLQEKKVAFFFDVDASEIHRKFRNKRFERIHWNCPFGVRGAIPEDIKKFFKSASNLQLPFDRIHMTLAQEEGIEEERQGYDYNIVEATALAGYRLVRKREFSTRFPNYSHVKTETNDPYDFIKREFVFEKIPSDEYVRLIQKKSPDTAFLKFANSLKNPKEKSFDVKFEEKLKTKLKFRPAEIKANYFECSTDDDTTDYFTDSEIEEIKESSKDEIDDRKFPSDDEKDDAI